MSAKSTTGETPPTFDTHKLVMFLNQRKPTRGVTSWHRMEPKGGRMDTKNASPSLFLRLFLSLSQVQTHTHQNRHESHHNITTRQVNLDDDRINDDHGPSEGTTTTSVTTKDKKNG